jgi:hypothetical protein
VDAGSCPGSRFLDIMYCSICNTTYRISISTIHTCPQTYLFRQFATPAMSLPSQ